MPHEYLPTTPRRRSPDVFGLTEPEQLHYRLPKARLEALIKADETTVHQVSLDSNDFGEYLFVLMSRVVEGQRYGLTCYGLGFHEQREQWITQHWYWYESHSIDHRYQTEIDKTTALQLLSERETEISAATNPLPSSQAFTFALLADLADEDFAKAELDDLED